eukprot:8892910-Pyramimonas_sp.AAC.1
MLCLLGAGRALLLSPSSSPLLQLAAPPRADPHRAGPDSEQRQGEVNIVTSPCVEFRARQR